MGSREMLTQVQIAFYKPNGVALANAPFNIQLTGQTFDNDPVGIGEEGIYMPTLLAGNTGSNGKAIINLFPSLKAYVVTCEDPDSDNVISYKFYVPEVAEGLIVRLQDILDPVGELPPSFDVQSIRIIAQLRGEVVASKLANDAILASIETLVGDLPVIPDLVNPVTTNVIYNSAGDLTAETINGILYEYTYLTPGGKIHTKTTAGKVYTYLWNGDVFNGMTVANV
jgi:hypothetical protein